MAWRNPLALNSVQYLPSPSPRPAPRLPLHLGKQVEQRRRAGDGAARRRQLHVQDVAGLLAAGDELHQVVRAAHQFAVALELLEFIQFCTHDRTAEA